MGTSLPETPVFSISQRLSRNLSVLAVAVFVLTIVVAWFIVRTYAMERLEGELLSRAKGLIALSEQEKEGVEIDYVEGSMQEYETDEAPFYFQFWIWEQGVGKSLLRSPSLRQMVLPKPEVVGTEPTYRFQKLADGKEVYSVAIRYTPITDEDLSEPRQVVIGVSTGLAETRKLEFAVMLLVMVPLVLFFLVHLAGIRMFVRKGLSPLGILARKVERIDISSLDTQLSLPSPPKELVPLLEKLNLMLDRLKIANARERRFSSDVAHELRTPIAEIRLLCEVYLRNAGDIDASDESYEDILEAAHEMEATVETLLAIARAEAETGSYLTKESCHPHGMVEMISRRYHVQIMNHQLQLHNNVAESLTVVTDCRKLELILGNLIGNAMNYAPDGSACSVDAVITGEDSMALLVSNVAPALQQEDMDLLFDRFWQKDASRSRNGSSGLGLSLVKSLCGLLGITVSASLDKAQILTVRLENILLATEKE